MAQAITNLLTPSFKPSTSVANFLPTTTTPAQAALNNKTTGSSGATGNSQVSANQVAAAKLGITLPGVGGGSSISAPQSQPVSGLVNPNPPVPAQAAPPTSSVGTYNPQGQYIAPNTSQPANTPSYPGLVTQIQQGASAPSKEFTDAMDAYQKNIGKYNESVQNEANTLAENSKNPIPLEFQQGRGQVIQNQYTQQQSGLGGLVSASANALNAANTQQGTRQSGLVSAAGFAAPQGYGLTTQPYNPLTDTFGGGGTNGAIDRATQAGNISSAQGFAQDYNTGKAQLAAADGIQNQIIATLQSNPTLNNTPISAITNLQELISGQISSGPQQLLSQQIAQYIQTLGLDPASVVNIAHQQQGTLTQLLDSLRQTAQTINESKNPANLKSGSSTGSSNSSSNSGPITSWDDPRLAS